MQPGASYRIVGKVRGPVHGQEGSAQCEGVADGPPWIPRGGVEGRRMKGTREGRARGLGSGQQTDGRLRGEGDGTTYLSLC